MHFLILLLKGLGGSQAHLGFGKGTEKTLPWLGLYFGGIRPLRAVFWQSHEEREEAGATFRKPPLSAIKINPNKKLKQSRSLVPLLPSTCRGWHRGARFPSPHLAGLNITTGGSQQETLPGAEKARKEITRKKVNQTLLQAQFEFYLSHTFPRLAQQRPSPLLSNKLLVVQEHVDKQGRCCGDSTGSPPTMDMPQSPGHQWAGSQEGI